ncbi:Mss4-like protein [Mycena crocata]|nr:Mss4-like protein [Mycena crocata]
MSATGPSKASDDPGPKSYAGNCHCGAFKFTVKLPSLSLRPVSCDCNLCSHKAYLWANSLSANEHFTVVQGKGCLKDYRHGETSVHKVSTRITLLTLFYFSPLQFCPTCGTFIICCEVNPRESNDTISVNLRALIGVDIALLEDASPEAQPPINSSFLQDDILYHANCHCGGIAYTLQAKPLTLPGTRLQRCNCSMCSRAGVMWAYPAKAAVTVHTQASLVEYSFGRKLIVHGFCGICGVPMWEQFLKPEKAHSVGLNVRAMNISVEDFAKLPKKVHNGAATLPLYEIV